MIKITSHGIIGTKIQIFEAWTPTTLKGEYISLSRIDGELHGRIGTSESHTKDEWCSIIGISVNTFYQRIRKGYTGKKMLAPNSKPIK